MSRDSWGSNLVFFLLGASVGAAAALLYAPQEGEATRRLIGDKATEYRGRATEMTGTVTQAAKEKINMATDRVQDILNRTNQAANDGMNTAVDQVRTPVGSTS